MEAKTILLVNVIAIMFISSFSDYWIVLKIRQATPPPFCDVISLRQYLLLRCVNASYALVEQHANLFRQCNDMTEGYRRNASRSGLLHPTLCHWFIADPPYTWRNINASYELDLLAAISAIFAVFSAVIGYYHSCKTKPRTVAKLLALSACLYAVPILISMNIIHSTNTRQPKTEEQFLYYSEAGWSLICAIIATVLMGFSSYLYVLQMRFLRERQRSQRRRRQLHNAIMSSCRQDIAMAIRARMTVI